MEVHQSSLDADHRQIFLLGIRTEQMLKVMQEEQVSKAVYTLKALIANLLTIKD
jgi:hypothetical protein